MKFEDTIELGPDGVAKGPIQQRGMGSYTLCNKCNNDTGHWYGNPPLQREAAYLDRKELTAANSRCSCLRLLGQQTTT